MMDRAGWLVAFALVLAPCAPPLPPAAAETSLVVEYAGCAALTFRAPGEPVCEVTPDSSLIVWVRAPVGAALVLELDGEPATVTATAVQDGLQFRVSRIRSEHSLAIGAAFDGERHRYHLALAPHLRSPEFESARRLRNENPEAAIAFIESSLKAGVSDATRAKLTGLRAKIDKVAGRPETEGRFLEAIERDREAGLIDSEVKDRFVLSLWYADHGDYDQAREILDEATPLLAFYPEGRAMEPNYRGYIDMVAGELDPARRALKESEAASERLNLDRHLTDVYQFLAQVSAGLGRYDEALRYIDAVDTDARRGQLLPRQLAQLFINAGYAILLAQQAGGDFADASARDPILYLKKARDLLRPGGRSPADPNALASVELNLALAALRAERFDEARAYVEAAQTANATIKFVLESSNYIWAELALADRDPQLALEYFELLTGAELRVGAMSGRARALEMLDRIEEARAAHRKADELLSEFSAAVPLGQGRSLFLERHREIPSRRIDFLVRQAELAEDAQSWLEEALSTARVSNGRVLRSLCPIDSQAREEYQKESAEIELELENVQYLPSKVEKRKILELEHRRQTLLAEFGRRHRCAASASTLVAPAPEELLLVYHPMPGGWIGFAGLDGRVLTARIGPLPTFGRRDEQASLLLHPFVSLLELAKRVRVGSSGLLQRVDFENLPWRGKTLLAAMPVTRGLDVPTRDRGARPLLPSALIVADPLDNFPHAQKQAEVVKNVLAERYPARLSLIKEDASRDRVPEEIEKPELELFHYAGHGSHSGGDGWLSEISLFGGALNIADVVALDRVPRYVTLSSCSTAATDETIAVSEFGVAQAFVSMGAEFAIAPTRNVKDEDAFLSIEKLYADPYALLEDPAEVLHQIAARSLDPDPSGFRVIVP